MINTDSDIQHGLSHLVIGEGFIKHTIESDRFSKSVLDDFFEIFREGHRSAIQNHSEGLGIEAAEIIGYDEHHELDFYGSYGKFAGRLSVRESGLAIVETKLHYNAPEGLIAALNASCARAVSVLRS